jgi:hypothetical protein
MKNIDEKYFENFEQYIPEGIYCYKNDYECPFHDCDENLDEQENGYCHFLKQSDHDINSQGGTIVDMKTGEKIELDYYPFGGLLWDWCKECNIKNYNRWCLDCEFMIDLKDNNAYCTKQNKLIDVETSICNFFKPSKEFE